MIESELHGLAWVNFKHVTFHKDKQVLEGPHYYAICINHKNI